MEKKKIQVRGALLLDGWGKPPPGEGNAISRAQTPFLKS